MKNYILLLLFVFICCKSESKSSNALKTDETETNQVVADVSDETNAYIVTTKTYRVIQEGKKGAFTQNLSVSWLSDNTIQYTLVFESQSCKKKTVGGRATSVKPGKEPFMNSYKGASFEVTKYKGTTKDFRVLLQIDTMNKDKAIVSLTSTQADRDENCLPQKAVMLEQ